MTDGTGVSRKLVDTYNVSAHLFRSCSWVSVSAYSGASSY
jgi:hypothetical protein